VIKKKNKGIISLRTMKAWGVKAERLWENKQKPPNKKI